MLSLGPVKSFASSLVLVLSATSCVFGCKADKVESGVKKDDAGVEVVLAPPTFDSIPELTPNRSVAIRGTTDGKRVVIQGGSNGTNIISVLPGGAFCGDVSLPAEETTRLTVYAMGDGLISTSTKVLVTNDAAAPAPSSPTCSGTKLPNCDVPEICTNGVDDNCNSWIDECDLECSQCEDDEMEPNDSPINAPLIAKGSYDLQICPCRDDWFAFERKANTRIKATVNFSHATMDLDLFLYEAAEDGGKGDVVNISAGVSNQEVIDVLVDKTTVYLLEIRPFRVKDDSGPGGSYQLKIE